MSTRPGSAPASDTWARAAARLWPGAAVSSTTRAERATGRVLREFVYFPDARRPRLLLPTGAPKAAAAALRRYSHDLSAADRIGRHLASVALATGLPERMLRDVLRVTAAEAEESVETHLSDVLGQPVVVSIGLGTARANRKPILHALSPEGETVAFVKVGDTDVARELVRAEAAALAYLRPRPLAHLSAPRVLHLGTWRDVELLVLSPLETTARRWRQRDVLPVDAMTELSAVDGMDRDTVGDSAFWRRMNEVPDRLADPESARLLSGAIARIGSRYGDTVLELGAWHGDWTPWNMAWRRATVQLWDWERFGRGVPRGFDALHYRLQDVLRSARGAAGTSPLPSWTAGTADVLAPFGVSGRAAPATTALYLADLCCRYLLAAQEPTGTPLRPWATWLLRAIHDHAQGG